MFLAVTLGDVMVNFLARVAIQDFLDAVDDITVAALNVASKRIVKSNGIGERTYFGVGQDGLAGRTTPTVHKNILQNFDGRAKPQSTCLPVTRLISDLLTWNVTF
jgi:hypothetical protein